ncbi:MAG: TPM domain-containing protein, partial [Verrucomicrobiota bacterium]|nr:TPM domain-containing protein [Verrucomicrobiota bacterium]
MTHFLGWVLTLLLLTGSVHGAEKLPPKPNRYLNDYANLISPTVEQELNGVLEQFEKASSSQIIVAIYPRMESDSSIEDYTQRVAESWGVGQKQQDNGVVLFVFVQDRTMFIQVGYGLEGAIPDITAKSIIEGEIVPQFKQGKFEAGIRAGITALISAARGEYSGSGRTVAQNQQRRQTGPMGYVGLLILLFIVISALKHEKRGTLYRRGGRSTWHGGGWSGWGGGGGFGGGG